MAWLIEAYNNDFIESSVEQVLEVCNLFNIRPLTEAEQLEMLTESAGSATAAYTKLGVKDAANISAKVAKASKDIANTIKKEGISKASKEHVKSKLNDLYDDIARNLEVDIVTGDKNSFSNKMKQATALLFGTITVSYMCAAILGILFGPANGDILSGIIIAPLIEEGSKQVAIKGGYAKEYTVIFNAFEASKYIIKYSVLGNVPFLNMVKARIAAVGMHVTTTIIQYLTQNEAIQKKLGIENDEKGKDNLRTIGNIAGMVIHTVWNTLATFSPTFNFIISGSK